jgi:hypothetical protein
MWVVPIGWTPSTTATNFYASREMETGSGGGGGKKDLGFAVSRAVASLRRGRRENAVEKSEWHGEERKE